MTSRVVGLESLLVQLQPNSARAKKEARKCRFYGVDDYDAWAEERSCLVSLELWATSQEPDWHTDFERLPELKVVLENEVPLQESELFQVKRFLYHASRILSAATFNEEHLACAESLAQLMHTIHPEAEASPRFILSENLHRDLGPARSACRAARNTLKTLRDQLEAEIVHTHAGRFDIHGFFRPGPDFKGDARLDATAGPLTLSVPELSEAQANLKEAERIVDDLELEIRVELTKSIRAHRELLSHAESSLLHLDLRLARIRLKDAISGTWPVWGNAQRVEGFRSPLFDGPTSIDLPLAQSTLIIAGPNMGGKSTVLKALGLAQWCLQHLMPVPATLCELAPVHHIIYIGSEDNPSVPGLSAFAREIQRLVDWWKSSSPALWLLDEIARGTHPEEGAEIAAEVLNLLTERGERVLCATHFPQVTQVPNAAIYRVAGLPPSREVERALAQSHDPLQCLKSMMDYRLVESDPGHVPRDARVVAIALGLGLKPSPED